MPEQTSAGAAADLADLRFCLVGPGRVGTSLASWALARGAHLVRVAGRRREPARELAERSRREANAGGGGAETVAVELSELESADCHLLLVAVTDGAVPQLAARLAGRPQAPVVLHTAGSLGASALHPLAGAGSFHPLKAFPRPLPELSEAAGTFFALDGAPAAVALGERLAAAFGGVSGVVPEAARDLYHLGATVAAGGVATLVSSSAGLVAGLGLEAGLPEAVLRGYVELARGALAALEREPGPGAITGPLARGDQATFLRELEALRALGRSAEPVDDRLALLCRLGVETVRLTAGDEAAHELAATLRERGLLDPGRF